MRSHLSTPPSAAKGPPALPVLARRDHARGLHPATRLPSCAQNFLPNLTQSLANSRLTLLHLYVPLTLQRIGQRDNSYRLPAARIPLRFARCPCTKTAICAAAVNHPHHINHVNHSSNKCQRALIPVNPFHPPPKGLQPNPHSPAATTRAAFASRPSAVIRPKFLAQSHTISRKLSSNAPASLRALTFQRIGQRDNSYRLPAARIPLRFARFSCTKPAICVGAGAAAVNHPHHINHVNHSSDKCQRALVRALLPEQPLQPPHPTRHAAPIRKIFFREQRNTRIHAAIRATSRQFDTHLTHRQDTEQGII